MDSDSVTPLLVIAQTLINPPTAGVFFANFIILVLIICSGIMSGSEIAFFSLSNVEINNLRESDNPTDNRVARLLEHPRYLLSTILISNNLVNIGVVVTSYYVTKQMFNFQDLHIADVVLPDYVIEFVWNVLIVTFFLVLFGEATPKVYATHNKLNIARTMSGVFNVLIKVFQPINYVLVESTRVLEKRLTKYNAEIDIEEIDKAIEITVEQRESKQDAKLLRSIVHFGNIMVKQVMRPRQEVAAIDRDINFNELMSFVRETGYSRYPVYQENPDNIIGVLNIKDLIEHLNTADTFDWQNFIRPPFFVPVTKKIDDLLREMQQNRKHLAIVVDEYGGTEGIITLEDILEEVVGDISDEFDEASESGVKKLDERNFLFDGKTQLTDVNRIMELKPDTFDEVRGEAETLAGLVLEATGKIPRNGEEHKIAGFKFTIVSVQNNRIEKVKVTNENQS